MKCLKCNRAFDEEFLINTEIGLVCGQCLVEELDVKADNKLDRTCDVCGKETGVLVVEGERQVCTECLEEGNK